jgi:hypothetical protein
VNIVATAVVRDGIKLHHHKQNGKRLGQLFSNPQSRKGHLKIGPVWPDRLGLSLRSLLMQEINIINSPQLVEFYNTYSQNMWVHAIYKVLSFTESCIHHPVLLFVLFY